MRRINFIGNKKLSLKPLSIFLLSILSCGAQQPAFTIDAATIARFFVNPSPEFINFLSNDKVPLKQWDGCLPAASSLHAQPAGIFSEVIKDGSGVEYTLGWETPSAIKTDTGYPLIIYLHGGTGSPLTTKGEKAYDMLQPLADSFSLFLASPSANRFTPWWSPEGIERILQTLRFMTMRYPINPDKVFLAGVSDGATGCYAAANTACGPFAGFIAVSGFGGMLPQVSMPLIPANIRQRPIYNVNAGKDRIYSISQVVQFLDWLKQNGVMIDHKEYPDEQHGFDYRAREFGTLANYIRTWSKPTPVNGIEWTFVPGFPYCVDNLIDCVTDNTAQSIFIKASWESDTLNISAGGMKEMIVSFLEVNKPVIFAKLSGNKPLKIRALSPTALLAFKSMLHSGFPRARLQTCYRIKF
jgi:pimeloyl-ACP methyl ester carboxylesterase